MTCFSADESLPRISPKGYNASLTEDIVFRCSVALDTFTMFWIINGVAGDQLEEDQGITPNNNLVTEGDTAFATISVQATAENDNITLGCVAVIHSSLAYSEVILFRFQGNYIMCMCMHYW